MRDGAGRSLITAVVAPEGPPQVDRVVVHQFDPASPSPGGIDTCLRGLARYAPEGTALAFVGVDAGSGPEGRALGQWEQHRFGDRTVWFLPVASFDPANQQRRIPHSVRLIAGVARYRSRIPRSALIQAHRADTAWASSKLLRRPLAYFIHTQENGLLGATSDSFWRSAAGLHRAMERSVVRRALDVVVFNEPYADLVKRWNPRARFSPTWYDPALVSSDMSRDERRVIWVGRLEIPKDPVLAVRVFDELARGDAGWSLDIVGSGTQLDAVRDAVERLGERGSRITIHGRLRPSRVAQLMAASGVFLMTSHPGYEGFPRVLVEALASGTPAVVTEGSDTGNLITSRTGVVSGRDPKGLAAHIPQAALLDRAEVAASVAHLSAPRVVADVLSTRGIDR